MGYFYLLLHTSIQILYVGIHCSFLVSCPQSYFNYWGDAG